MAAFVSDGASQVGSAHDDSRRAAAGACPDLRRARDQQSGGTGGAQRQVVDLANNVDPASTDVHVCSLSPYVPLADRLTAAAERLHIVTKRFKYDTTVPFRLAALLRRLHADVVHGYLFDAEVACRVAGRLAGTPLVVGSERNTNYRLKRVQLAAYRLTRSCVDLVVANSQAGAEFNSRVLDQPPAIYRVVHNGVDTDRFQPGDASAIRAELGIDTPGPVVGMFGSFKEQKNHPLFFEAASQVLHDSSRSAVSAGGRSTLRRHAWFR